MINFYFVGIQYLSHYKMQLQYLDERWYKPKKKDRIYVV